ncbi:MAG: spore cortex biosynthesis protein YabQ [Clostridia bacterium]|nr:spore cortex biosynthesis protein YabQ [Clostridia bacterium]
MINEANIYLQLLIFSFLCGTALRMFRDFLALTKALIFYNNHFSSIKKTNSEHINSRVTSNTAISCHKESSIIKAAFILYPNRRTLAETIFTAMCDLAFAMIAAITVILLANHFNRGELRGFIFPVMLFGYSIYSVTLSKFVYSLTLIISSTIIKMFLGVLTVTLRIIKILLRPPVRILKRILNAAHRKALTKKSTHKRNSRRQRSKTRNISPSKPII